MQPQLIEGKDYYINEKGLWVFTADYHLRRGYCCGSGCMHCPYGFSETSYDSTKDILSDGSIRTTDQMGHTLTIPFPPKRIISLVPSQTELLFDLGLENKVVGVTKFCVHPEEQTKHKDKIGGTKKFSMEKIHALQPDLIIGNKEENYPEGIQMLQEQYPVWMSDILNLNDACSMIMEIARITDSVHAGNEMVKNILGKFHSFVPLENKPMAAYFIWREPYMVAGSDTFINEMMMHLGVTNIFGHLTRYPEVTIDAVRELNPELIFLSSEPYPFFDKHVEEFQALLPSAKIIIVDGQYFSWYGSRLLKTPDYFNLLKPACS